MKFYALILSALVSWPAMACIWDSDCVTGERCMHGTCKFKPPGGRGAVMTATAAVNSSVPQETLDKMAADYFVSERLSSGLMRMMNTDARGAFDPHRCDQEQENGPSCVDEACKFLGNFGCDQMNQVDQVGRACRGNFNGSCVNATCTRLGNFGCDQMSEVESVAVMCRGNHSGKCVEIACNHLGNFGCDQMDEVQRVNNACRGVKASCVDSVCQKLGTFGCDQMDEIERVAASCRGN